jgi:fermentation-respiration switch protein FrsA (DUF1100 family)
MIVVLALVAAGLLLLWGWYSSDLILSLHRERITVLPGSFGLAFEEVTFKASDGTPLKGWFVPSPVGSDATIILCHGRGTCRSDILPATQHLVSRGHYNLLYFDFRNHGESGGRKTTLGRLETLDLEAALDWVKKAKPDRSRRVGVYGLSMGAAVVILAAARRPEIEAVAAESAYGSIGRSVAQFGKILYGLPAWAVPYTMWWTRARLGFNPETAAAERVVGRIAPRPIFLLQGGADDRVPPSEGERLFNRAGEPKSLWTVPGAGHGGLWEAAGREYEDRLLKFFDGVFRRAG